MTFAILILVNQTPEINSAALSDELPSLPDLPVCSLTNDRFPFPPPPPTQENFSPHPLLLKPEHYAMFAVLHDPICKAVSEPTTSFFLPSHSCLLLNFSFWWRGQCVHSPNFPESLSALSQHQEELSPFLSPNLHEQKGQFSVINTACVMKDFPNWEKQLIKPSFSENSRDRRPGICLSLIVQSLTFSLFPGLDWDFLNYLLILEKNKRYVHVINYPYNVVFQEFFSRKLNFCKNK